MPVKFEAAGEKHETEDLVQGLGRVLEKAYPLIWKQLDGLIIRSELVREAAERLVPEPFDWKEDTEKAARAIAGISSPKITRMLEPRNDEEKEMMKALLTRIVLERIGMIK